MADRDAMMMNIANEVHAVRPAWDVSGIIAALRKIPADRDLEWSRAAALAAARNRGIRSPAVIPMGGDHWETTKLRVERPVSRGPLCRCGKTREGHDQAEALVAPELRHPFEPEDAYRARSRDTSRQQPASEGWRKICQQHGIEPRTLQPVDGDPPSSPPVSVPNGFKGINLKDLSRG